MTWTDYWLDTYYIILNSKEFKYIVIGTWAVTMSFILGIACAFLLNIDSVPPIQIPVFPLIYDDRAHSIYENTYSNIYMLLTMIVMYICIRYIIIPRLAGLCSIIMLMIIIGYLIELQYAFINIMYALIIVNTIVYGLLRIYLKTQKCLV